MNTFATTNRARASGRPGFSLIELLVVIAIIGLLAAIGLPRLRGISRSNAMATAVRQFSDDLGLARLKALSSRSSVYVVFLPALDPAYLQRFNANTNALKTLRNIFGSQLSAYAIITERAVGDQPGQGIARYVSEWRHLPEGVVFAPSQFDVLRLLMNPAANVVEQRDPDQRLLGVNATPALNPGVPFPLTGSGDPNPAPLVLPALKFNALGQMSDGVDRTIRLTRGSVFVTRDPQQHPTSVNRVIVLPKGPPYLRGAFSDETWVVLTGLTGRASVVSNPDEARVIPP